MRRLFYRAVAAHRNDQGVTVIEYGFTLAFVSVVLVVLLATLGIDVFDAVEATVLAAL